MLAAIARTLGALAFVAALAVPLPAAMLLGTIGQHSDNSLLVEISPVTGELIRTIGNVGYTVNGLT